MTDLMKIARDALDNVQGPARRLEKSIARGADLLPFSESVQTASAEEAIDALLQRFQQVSDLLLRKVFPRLLAAETARTTALPFRDVLDNLEKLSLIDSADWWWDLNDLRNRLIHEYAMSNADRAEALNQLWQAAPVLIEQIARFRARMEAT